MRTHQFQPFAILFSGMMREFRQRIEQSISFLQKRLERKTGIQLLLKTLRKHKSLQFQLLEERMFLSPGVFQRRTDFESSYLALSKDHTFIEFDAFKELKGVWHMVPTQKGLKLTYSAQSPDFRTVSILGFANQYLIVSCSTESGELQRIYELTQKKS